MKYQKPSKWYKILSGKIWIPSWKITTFEMMQPNIVIFSLAFVCVIIGAFLYWYGYKVYHRISQYRIYFVYSYPQRQMRQKSGQSYLVKPLWMWPLLHLGSMLNAMPNKLHDAFEMLAFSIFYDLSLTLVM